ncbi:MAG: amidohydrolase family protein [Cellvibrionaceae bacterium]
MAKLLFVIIAFLTASVCSAATEKNHNLVIIDSHIHYSHDAWEEFPPKEALKILQESGLKKAFVSSSSDEGTQKLYSLAPDFIVPVLRPYRERGETFSWKSDESVIGMLSNLLKQNTYLGIGEFHAFGKDMELPVLKSVIALAKQYGIFLHAHSDAEAVEGIFTENPKAIVLWAHAGFTNTEEIRSMLKKHPNLWADLAYREDYAYGSKVNEEWRQLFTEFPDRFMLGTDTYTPERWYYVNYHHKWSREWLSDLPKPLAENIAYRNAERLLAKVK